MVSPVYFAVIVVFFHSFITYFTMLACMAIIQKVSLVQKNDVICLQ